MAGDKFIVGELLIEDLKESGQALTSSNFQGRDLRNGDIVARDASVFERCVGIAEHLRGTD